MLKGWRNRWSFARILHYLHNKVLQRFFTQGRVMDNPYNPLQSNPDYFYGCEEAFAFFRQNLVGAAHKHALVLVGRRGLGKTAVLHQLPYQLDERYSLCIVSLGLIGLGDEHSFFAALVDDIRAALELAEASTYRLPEWPEAAEPDGLRDWFRDEYLEIALTALRTRHLLLALDDAHLLLEAIDRGTLPADLLDYLLGVLLKYPRLDMVFTLDEAFEDRILALELFRDPTLHFRLAELSLEDAERLVREPVQDMYHYEDGVVKQILALAGGHPFLLHSICRLLFRRSEERHHAGPVIENDLAAVDDAVLEQGSEVLNPLWQAASQNERLVLMGLVRLNESGEGVSFGALYDWINASGYEMNKTKVAAALRSLDYKGLIQADPDGTYALRAQFIPRWLNANHALDVKKKTAAKINMATLAPLVGLAAALLLVGGLVAASLAGALDGDDEMPTKGSPTATLSLNYQASQQAIFETQTEQARPTRTLTLTQMPASTRTPTATQTATQTASWTVTPNRTATANAEATAAPTETAVPTRTPRPLPTNTPRATATLDPGD